MNYKIIPSSQFKRDLALAIRRESDMSLIDEVVSTLAQGGKLAQKYRDHALSGKYKGKRECHITPDWLLVYERDETCVRLVRTGSHSDLFR